MHGYLKSIGFSELIRKKDIDQIIDEVVLSYNIKNTTTGPDGRRLAQMFKAYGQGFGISVFGEYDENDKFLPEYYFPFFSGSGISTTEDVSVERHGGRESYAGGVEDIRVGATLFFFLQNVGEYLEKKNRGELPGRETSVTLSALASEAVILFPIEKRRRNLEEEHRNFKERERLLKAARKGDEQAMETLTMEDLDTYAEISRRLNNEDVFSIVESFFIPCGIECDQYHILGDILAVEKTINKKTGEAVYQMSLMCNDMPLDVCVNEKDLMGTPVEGFRFQGYVWLQGKVNMTN